MNTYANDTQGIEKTNFVEMYKIAEEVLENIKTGMALVETLDFDGVRAGVDFVGALNKFEDSMKYVGFNSFSNEVSEKSIINIASRMIFLMAVRMEKRKCVDANMKKLCNTLAFVEGIRAILKDLVELASSKDREYGASWCKRGGVGAWFTSCRKFDRLITQIENKDWNVWEISDDINTTEALEETLMDGVNYLLLIIEKRRVIQKNEWMQETLAHSQFN